MRLSVFYLYSSPLDCECKGRIESLFSLTLLNAGVIPPNRERAGICRSTAAAGPSRHNPRCRWQAQAGFLPKYT